MRRQNKKLRHSRESGNPVSLFRSFLLLFLLGLPACGFSPLYGSRGGDGSPVAEAISNIAIANIPNEHGQQLRNKLIDRFYFHGRPQKPSTTLTIFLGTSEADLGIQKDATASLSEVTLTASFSLTKQGEGSLLNSTAKSVVIYSKLDAQYGTLAAQRNAYDRAVSEVCEQIVNQISLYYAEPPEPPLSETPEKSWALGKEAK